ncbi:alpha/beta hydrolase [Niallia circulans]|uniref:RBBP9/YdeN family alpha/beta hydrolase n=2 Tax=Niallia circulans TaxID=1397 RepID=UPI0039823A9D
MNKLYLMDGYGGSPEINWLSDINKDFNNSFNIQIVEYTDATIANVKQWDLDLDKAIKEPNNAYFICHSLGCVTFLRYLSRYNIQIKGAVFVSGFAESIEAFPQFDPYMQEINLDKIKHLLGDSFLISSRTDTIIDWRISNTLADKLEIPFILLPSGGHFTSGEGIIEMPPVKDIIKGRWL